MDWNRISGRIWWLHLVLKTGVNATRVIRIVVVGLGQRPILVLGWLGARSSRFILPSPHRHLPNAFPTMDPHSVSPSPLQRDVGQLVLLRRADMGRRNTREDPEMRGPHNASRKWATTFVVARFIPSLVYHPHWQHCCILRGVKIRVRLFEFWRLFCISQNSNNVPDILTPSE